MAITVMRDRNRIGRTLAIWLQCDCGWQSEPWSPAIRIAAICPHCEQGDVVAW